MTIRTLEHSNTRTLQRSNTSRSAFTLIEMLVVIGIIAVLSGIVFVSMGKITKTAQRAKAQETVSNAATALTYIFQKNMRWPTLLTSSASGGEGRLDANVSKVFVKQGEVSGNSVKALMGVNFDAKAYGNGTVKLIGADACGIVSPWAATVLKKSANPNTSLKVPSGKTIQDHILYYAVDLDGDGITVANVGGKSLRIRASAVCWCAGADGELGSYGQHSKAQADDVYSWNSQQVEK